MALPDSVSNAARDAFEELDGPLLYGYKAAIRAALQAMQDNGMAVVTYDLEPQGTTFVKKPRLTIRLDADERKPEEQR